MNTATIEKYVPYIAASGTVVFWASAFPGVKYCLDYYSPESLMLFRFLVASAVLLVYTAFISKEKFKTLRLDQLKWFALTGGVGIFLYMWAFNSGTKLVPSGISSFIIASAPVFTLILSMPILKEKPTAANVIGIFVSLAGLGIITLSQSKEMTFNYGILLLLGSSIFTSLYSILQRRLLVNNSAIMTTTLCIAFGTLMMFVFFPKLIREFPQAPLDVNLIIVYLGVFPAALAYFLWGYALSKAEKTVHIISFLYLVPFVTVVLSYLWLGEVLAVLDIVGGVIIISGLIITSFLKKRSS